MVVRPELRDDPAFRAALQQDRIAIATRVFGGAPVEMHLCDERFNVLAVLGP